MIELTLTCERVTVDYELDAERRRTARESVELASETITIESDYWLCKPIARVPFTR